MSNIDLSFVANKFNEIYTPSKHDYLQVDADTLKATNQKQSKSNAHEITCFVDKIIVELNTDKALEPSSKNIEAIESGYKRLITEYKERNTSGIIGKILYVIFFKFRTVAKAEAQLVILAQWKKKKELDEALEHCKGLDNIIRVILGKGGETVRKLKKEIRQLKTENEKLKNLVKKLTKEAPKPSTEVLESTNPGEPAAASAAKPQQSAAGDRKRVAIDEAMNVEDIIGFFMELHLNPDLLPKPAAELDPTRSAAMDDFLKKLDVNVYDDETNSLKLQIKNGAFTVIKNYTPITRETTDFSTQCLVSCGSSKNREIILLDPTNSPKLTEHLNHLLTLIRGVDEEPAILQIVHDYVRKTIFKDNKDLENRLNAFLEEKRDQEGAPHLLHSDTKIPVISIDEFVEKGLGVCRHHSLVTCYLLHSLVRLGKLKGEVIHMRGNYMIQNKSVAHAWVGFSSVNNSRWHIDPIQNQIADLSQEANKLALEQNYGSGLIGSELAIFANREANKTV